MTLLQLVQSFCTRTGLPSPSFVVASTDAQIIQIRALLEEVCEDICSRWVWTALTEEATFTTLAQEDQGALSSLAPKGFVRILNETIFDRTLRLPIYGPMGASKWQALKALPTTGPFYKYRIRGGKVIFNPLPPAGHLCAFEYTSNQIALSSDGLTQRTYPTADDDTFVLDSKYLMAGLRWKWKAEKGLPYAEEFTRYENMVNDENGRDGTKPVINMGSDSQTAFPGIFVSPGNWNLP